MNKRIRKIAKTILPRRFLVKAWTTYCQVKFRKTKQLFESAPTTPAWLERETLEELHDSYALEEMTYLYDTPSVEKRGRERAHELLAMVPEDEEINRFLDLGSRDTTACHVLQGLSKTAIGIDIVADEVTEKVRQSNTPFLQMDVNALAFADNSFDFVFSYCSFEHFPDPERALLEALRTVRVGGYIYLHFGPLYLAPKGAHQFHAITVPYCQCLFQNELLLEFAKDRGLELNSFHLMNGWRLEQFRSLWDKYSHRMETITSYEIYDIDHLDLIARYPGCFKSKTDHFEDLVVTTIEVLFKKVH